MKNTKIDKIVLLTMISGRKQKNAILSALTEEGVPLINTMYGRGVIKAGYWEDAFGLVPDENNVVIYSILTSDRADTVLDALEKKLGCDKRNACVAFTVPLNRLSF